MDERIIEHLKSKGLSDDEIKEWEEDYKRKKKIADEYKKEYHKARKCCPKCGAKGHVTTLMGYIFKIDDPKSFRDENNCTCTKCGDKHIYHDRVPEK